MSNTQNGWNEHKRLVEHRIAALEDEMNEYKKRANEHEVTLALLNLKSSAWGAMAGVAGSIALQILMYLLSRITQN